jgi:plasmid stabilization system protein ParE
MRQPPHSDFAPSLAIRYSITTKTTTGLGWRWVKERSYWIAFADNRPDIEITAIFHESANIPARLP